MCVYVTYSYIFTHHFVPNWEKKKNLQQTFYLYIKFGPNPLYNCIYFYFKKSAKLGVFTLITNVWFSL